MGPAKCEFDPFFKFLPASTLQLTRSFMTKTPKFKQTHTICKKWLLPRIVIVEITFIAGQVTNVTPK